MWILNYCAEKRLINSAVGLASLAELNRLTSEQLVKQEGQQRGAECSPTPTQKGAPSSFSITLKRTDSLTSHLLHSYSKIPLPLYPRKHTNTHTHTHSALFFFFNTRSYDWPGNIAPRSDISAHKLIHSSRVFLTGDVLMFTPLRGGEVTLTQHLLFFLFLFYRRPLRLD